MIQPTCFSFWKIGVPGEGREPSRTKRLAFAAGLKQSCTDIIRFSHGASSSTKVYTSSFIPGLHDTCIVFEKQS